MNLSDVDHMSGEEFERYLQAIFAKCGYHAELTKKSNDFGADLVFRHADGKRMVCQAKRYSKNVGVAAVQQVIGAREYYHAEKAVCITNAYFTVNAKKLAAESHVALWDRDTLKKLKQSGYRKETAQVLLP